jgi:phospholipase/carboxylesterase
MFKLSRGFGRVTPFKNVIYISINLFSVLSTPLYTIEKRNDDIYLIPKSEEHKETIVWLHGLGDSAEGFVDVFLDDKLNPVRPSTKVILLTAPSNPVTINNNYAMPSWYDIKVMSSDSKMRQVSFDERFSRKEINENTARIHSVFDEEIALLNNNPKALFVGGFSQGCAMSLHSGLEYKDVIGGIFGFSGYLFEITSVKHGKLPINLYHGAVDQMIPLGAAKASYKRLDDKFSLEVERSLAHSINPNQLVSFKKKFNKIIENSFKIEL